MPKFKSLSLIFLFSFSILAQTVLSKAPLDSTRYKIREINGKLWLVNSENEFFFSSGVCCVNPGVTFEEYSARNPGYAAWHNYSDSKEWADHTIERLKSWGFSTIGGWGNTDVLFQSSQMNLYYTPELSMGAGAPWLDMWDPVIMRNMEEACKKGIPPEKYRKYLIGYYTGNELGWWNAALWNMVFKNHPSSIARRKTIDLIREFYNGDWNLMLKDFDPEGAKSFDQLYQGGGLFLRPASNGMFVIKKFIGLMAERYYWLTKEIVRKYDKYGLILGDRYQSFYYPEVVKAAAKYVDVISTNLNANWNDGVFTRFFLSTLHELSNKPIAIGEFYLAANENRSGNKNSSATFPTVQTQEQRAKGFLTTARIITSYPYVVMADWFQYYDEPTFGRSDGENYNMGLVDIYDKPYEELVGSIKNFDWKENKISSSNEWSDITTGIPKAPKENLIQLQPKDILQNWDRYHGFVTPSSKAPLSDMYMCWDEDSLYIALNGDDMIEKEFYRNQEIPEEDRMLFTIKIENQEPIRIRLGAGKKPVWGNKKIKVFNSSGIFLTVKNITVLRIPAESFGKRKFEPTDKINFQADLQTFARAYYIQWKVKSFLTDKY